MKTRSLVLSGIAVVILAAAGEVFKQTWDALPRSVGNRGISGFAALVSRA